MSSSATGGRDNGSISSRAEERARARREQAVETRATLLRAAHDVFAEQGYKAASVKAITSRADTAHGTFYLYFRNKEDAFLQVFADVIDQMQAEAAAPWTRDPWASARKATAGFLDVFVQHPGLWRALLEAILLNPAIEQMWATIRGVFAERVTNSLRIEQETGAVRPFDPVQGGLVLVSMVEWYAFTHFVMSEPASDATPEAVGRAVDLLTDLWIHAVYGDRLDT